MYGFEREPVRRLITARSSGDVIVQSIRGVTFRTRDVDGAFADGPIGSRFPLDGSGEWLARAILSGADN
ncbi:hypothetical protein XI03_20150 [Bradyrhizobium sp. CCBAU 65884]|nr:hypothetical protein [Bradyrhizobium sp. CCBAU 65884]